MMLLLPLLHYTTVEKFPSDIFLLVSPGQALTRYAGRGSGQTPMLHSCLTRHSFCRVLTTGKVYKYVNTSVLINFTHLRNPLTATLMHTLYTLPVVNTPQKLWRVKHECNMRV